MQNQLLKKEGIALAFLARYLLTLKEGSRLKTIHALAKESDLSVGLIQAAFKSLEQSRAIAVDRQGRNGSFITKHYPKRLMRYSNISHLVCVMPLPYEAIYQGFASGLKAQLTELPFYFAHMRGSDARIQCLVDGVYHFAITSRLAAETSFLQSRFNITLRFGDKSYTQGHKLIFRKGEFENIQKVAVDPASADQKLISRAFFNADFRHALDAFFSNTNQTSPTLFDELLHSKEKSTHKDHSIEYVEIPYHDVLKQIVNKQIDASIWQVNSSEMLEQLGLDAMELPSEGIYQAAAQAVILTRKQDVDMQKLLQTSVNPLELLRHQQAVINGEIQPIY